MLSELLQKKHNRALQQALLNDRPTALLKAIRKGADLNLAFAAASAAEPARPIEHAVRQQSPELLALLLDAGAELPAGPRQTRLLEQAIVAEHQALALLTALLAAGADANGDRGSSFFHCLRPADDNQQLLLLTRLMEYGGDINVRDKRGLSPLDHLMIEEKTALVGALISAGARLSEQLEQLPCSQTMKSFGRRKTQDLQTQRLLLER